jgi:hypothetical protein
VASTKAALTRAEQSRQRLAEAKARYQRASQTLASAEINMVDVERRIRVADFDLTAEAITLARAELERAQALAQTTEREVSLAERSLLTDTPDVAEALARFVARILGVEAVATCERVTDTPAGALPLAVLVQRKPGQFSPDDGHLTGSVELQYVRTAHHIALDPYRLGVALTDAGVHVGEPPRDAFTQPGEGGLLIDSATYKVQSVPPVGMPLITAMGNPEAHLRGVGEGMAAYVRRYLHPVNPYGIAPNVNLSPAHRPTRRQYVDYADVVSNTTANGVRTIVGKVGVFAYSSDRFRELADHLARAAEAMTGTYGGVGRVTAIRLGESAPITGESGYRMGLHVEAIVTAESKTAP